MKKEEQQGTCSMVVTGVCIPLANILLLGLSYGLIDNDLEHSLNDKDWTTTACFAAWVLMFSINVGVMIYRCWYSLSSRLAHWQLTVVPVLNLVLDIVGVWLHYNYTEWALLVVILGAGLNVLSIFTTLCYLSGCCGK